MSIDLKWPPEEGGRFRRKVSEVDVDESGLIKGWVRFRSDGTIDASYNVSSIDDDGTGDFGVNWDQNFLDNNNSIPMVQPFNASDAIIGTVDNNGASSVEVRTWTASGAASDTFRIFVLAAGVQ